jgi:hypothetical protein
MKSKILSYLAIAAVAVGTTACSDSFNADIDGRGEGRLNTSSILPSVTNGEEIINESAGALKVKSRSSIDLSNYLVKVLDSNSELVESWTYSSMPSLPTFPVGTYTVKVESQELQDAAWNAPYFSGEQQFQIVNGGITDVETVVCTLANIRVSIVFDDSLLAAANGGADFKVTVTSAPGVQLVYTPSETRSGYFALLDGLSTLKVSFTGTIGTTEENTTAILTNISAGQHRKVTLGLKKNNNQPDDEKGNIEIEQEGVNVDFRVDEEDLTGDLTMSEETVKPGFNPGQEDPEPTDPSETDTPNNGTTDAQITFESETVDLDGTNSVADFGTGLKNAVVTIGATEGIQNLIVTIISNSLSKEDLEDSGLTDEFDLANPGQYETALKGMGFPVGNEVVGQTSVVFDITQFVPLLKAFPDEVHTFRIKVVDSKNNNKTQELKFQA